MRGMLDKPEDDIAQRIAEQQEWLKGYVEGKKDGETMEREAVLQIIEDVKTDHWPRESGRGDGYDLDTCDEILRRMSQRGEKR